MPDSRAAGDPGPTSCNYAWFLLPFDRALKKTLVILLFSPLASFDPIFTEKCGGDVGLSSEINSISIIISIVCMTLLLIIL